MPLEIAGGDREGHEAKQACQLHVRALDKTGSDTSWNPGNGSAEPRRCFAGGLCPPLCEEA